MPDAAVDTVGADEMMIDALDPNMPETLAATGLCVDAACTQIAPGIYPFTPRYELYSDTATKKRWIYLPPDTQINTANMDAWEFPVGTKLWKEFTRDTTRVETRIVMRVGPGTTSSDWFYAAYVWNQAQDATYWAEFGEVDANGTQHDVPGKIVCRTCHENVKPSRVLGFSALQLDIDGASGELDLADLVSMNLLSNPPTEPVSPGPYFPLDASADLDPAVFPALGYMHANCGHCHNPTSTTFSNTQVDLKLTLATLASHTTTPAYTTTLGVVTQNMINGHDTLVVANSPDTSVLIGRFEATDGNRMPAAGTEFMDTDGQTILRAWVTSIPPP